MSKGNLIRAPFSEIGATIELFDRLGVTADHLEFLRKASSWQQMVTVGVLAGDPYLLAMLGMEVEAKKAGFQEKDFQSLAGDCDRLGKVLDFVRGRAKIVYPEHLIDCDADPFIPDGCSVVEHRKGGMWKWDPKKVALYLSKGQQDGGWISGDKLRKELEKKPVLNANVLDYLLAHPHLIPEEWKGKAVFFWSTIYRGGSGDLRVRCLYWVGDRWDWSYDWLDGVWHVGNPAVLRA